MRTFALLGNHSPCSQTYLENVINAPKAKAHMALEITLRKSNLGQKTISFPGNLFGINSAMTLRY